MVIIMSESAKKETAGSAHRHHLRLGMLRPQDWWRDGWGLVRKGEGGGANVGQTNKTFISLSYLVRGAG